MHSLCNYELFECTFEAPYYISLFFPFFVYAACCECLSGMVCISFYLYCVI